MLISDPDLREHLRDLPTSYLIELLTDQDNPQQGVIREILWERGLAAGEVDALVQRRLHSRLPPIHTLWQLGRKLTLVSTALVSCFNLFVCYRLLNSDHSLRGLLLTLAAGCIGIGFFLGYKLSTHLYQGDRHRLFCGFPLAVGSVDLETCQETTLPKATMILALAGNALVGLSLMLFPLLLIYHGLT
jgi:hypothetical protein